VALLQVIEHFFEAAVRRLAFPEHTHYNYCTSGEVAGT
jgi:hypothetical protein